MLSQTAEYALRAAVLLGEQDGERLLTRDIAHLTQIPPDYLAKILNQMSKANLVTSKRGRNGGVLLAKAPSEISVLEVINAVDPICRIEACPLALEEHADKLCKVHKAIDDAIGVVEKTFRDVSLADLKAGRGKETFPDGNA